MEKGFENLWRYEGRVDDVMVLNTGWKVNPLHVEMKLQSHPALNGCVVFGTGYTKCGVLLEPKDHRLSKDEFVEMVWPGVQEANATVPEHARVLRELVVVTTKDKPFQRASKGTIIRKLTTVLYEKEIEGIYRAANLPSKGMEPLK